MDKTQTPNKLKPRPGFWPLVGMSCGAALLFTLAHALLRSNLTLIGLSDSLCISALILSVASGAPFLVDAGRGMGMVGKLGLDREQQQEALRLERAKRERGMRFTFAFALAALLMGLISIIASLV